MVQSVVERRAYHLQWRIKNRVHLAKWQKEYSEKNKERIQTYQSEYLKKHRDRILARKRKYHAERGRLRPRKKFPLIVGRAHYRVGAAIKKGLLIRPEACSTCNQKGTLHAHHPDYKKPLFIVWLCRSCHKKVHLNG